MKKSKLLITTVASFLIAAFAFCTFNVFAEESADTSAMTVSPTYQKIILTPGETYNGSIKVARPNDAEKGLNYSVSVGSFVQKSNDENSKDDYDTVDTETKTAYNEIMDWITILDEKGTVEPNTVDTIRFTIDVPKDAPGGGQYATINVQDDGSTTTEVNNNDTNGKNVNIQNITRISSIIYAEVAGETNKAATITENSIPPFSFGGGITASSMVKNEGNVHTDATYTLQVWSAFASESSEELYTNAEDPEVHLIMPETTRFVTTAWENAPAVGLFRVKQTVSIFDQTSETTRIVLVCPMWLLFVILIVIFFIIFWLVSRSRARKKASNGQPA